MLYNVPRFFEFKVVSRCDWLQAGGSSSHNGSSSVNATTFDCDQMEGPEYGLAVTETRKNRAFILVRGSG